MKQIRNNVFETNSSSVHSISIDTSGLEPSYLSKNKDNKIVVKLGTFDKDDRLYTTQDEKLSYLITCLYYILGQPYTVAEFEEDLYADYRFKYIEEAVCKYANADGIIVTDIKDAYIDHQSVPYNDIEIISAYNDESIIEFIFNKYIKLHTYCD